MLQEQDLFWSLVSIILKKIEIKNVKFNKTRIFFMLLYFYSVLLAVAIPNLELFISLFGALCLSALGLAFPAIIQISIYWYTKTGLDRLWLLLSMLMRQ